MARLRLQAVLVSAGAMLEGGTASAQSHAELNYMRAGSSVFVQQSLEAEYGQHRSRVTRTDEATLETSTVLDDELWKGYGLGTGVGVEIVKFLQGWFGHTLVNLRHRDDALESLIGSRFQLGARAVFSAPVVNLELGLGAQGSRLDYQKQLENGTLYGSGTYYSLGLNYFVTSRISVYYEAKQASEHLIPSGGSVSPSAIDTEMTAMGFGFRIWL